MNFKVIDFDNKKEWEKVAQNREVYYQWQYVDAFYKIGDGEPRLAYAEQDGDYVLNVFFLRNIAKDLKLDGDNFDYHDIITPYGYGGVDCTNSNNKELLDYFHEMFEKYCIDNNIVSEFIRLCPFTNNYVNYNDSYELLNISKTVYMKLDNPDQIWNDMEGRSRTAIRKAFNNNLVVKSGFSKEMFDEFVEIYRDTMSRDDAESYYFFDDVFFQSIYDNMKEFAKIYTVYLEDKPISSSIIMFNGQSGHYHLSGTLSEYMKYGANNLGLYEIALDLCKNGIKSFHLGGGYGGDSSPLLKFKRSFNKFGDLDFYIGKKIYNQNAYDELCKKRNITDKSGFFPAYRKEN